LENKSWFKEKVARRVNFSYDISVTDLDIKSPLPAREVKIDSNYDEVERKKITEPIEQRVNRIVEEKKEEVKVGGKNDVLKKIANLGKKKILIIIGLLVAVVLLLLIVSLAKEDKAEEVITLNYWGLWEDSTVMEGVVNDFESKNPGIKINYVRNQLTNYRSRLIGRLEKTGNTQIEGVDVFRIHNTWIPMFRKYLNPVPQESLDKIGLESDFFNIYKRDLVENNKWLSVPLMYDGLALFYNKDLVSEDELPQTWWDLQKIAKSKTERNENNHIEIAGVALGTAGNVDHWSDIVGVMMKQNGIDLSKVKENNYSNLGDVLTFYCSFTGKDGSWDQSLANSTKLFANGKLAFYIGPSWRIFDIQSLNSNLKFGITSLPQLPVLGEDGTSSDEGGLTNIHWASYWTEGVNSKSEHQKEAWKFIEYLSSVEGLSNLYKAESQIRDFGEIYPRKSMAKRLTDNWKTATFVNTADNAYSWYLASETNDDGLNDSMRDYFGDAINSILNGGGMEDVLLNLENGVNQVINLYKLKR